MARAGERDRSTRARRPGLRREGPRATHYGELLLLASDDVQIRRLLSERLGDHGFRVVIANSSRHIDELAVQIRPVMILLDLDATDGERIPMLARIREHCAVPVIVLSEHASEGDKVAALDAGADDYVAKPFGAKELLARIRVALRYARGRPPTGEPVEVGPIRIDVARYRVTVAGRPVHLTPTEFKLLTLLARYVGSVVTREHLLHEVWGTTADQTDLLRVHIAALRKKIETDPGRSLLITVVGVGYRLGEYVGEAS